MNTLLTTNSSNQVIKEEIEVSETVMQEQLFETALKEDTVDEYVTSGSSRTHEAKNDLNQHDAAKTLKIVKSFQCPKCVMFFCNRKLVQSHMRKKHDDVQRGLETCPICSRSCKYKSVLSVHMNNHREKVCPICNVVVSDSKALKNHVESLHIRELDFVCPICFKMSIDSASHDDHVSSHSGRQRYECVDCSKYYASLEGLERHRQTHARIVQSNHQVRYNCSICSKAYASERNLHVHMNRHSGIRPYKCDQCPKRFDSPWGLTHHRQTHLPGGGRVKCSICSKTLSSSRNLRFHMNTHTVTRPYKCDQCPANYGNPHSLKMHRIIHLDLPGKYKCSYCLKSYSTKQTLNCHINTHSGARPFKCDQCPKGYSSPQALTAHQKLHLPEITLRVKCSICSKTLSCPRSLRCHMNTHTGARPFKCSQCQNSFASPQALKQHQKAHLQGDKSVYKCSDRSFKCHQCVKAYASRGGLTRHYRDNPSHSSYEHKCSICSKAFCFKRSLKDHMKTHLEAPAYKCDECSKEFYSTSGLVQHRRIHLIDSKHLHKCPVCYETFTVKQSLIAHMNVHDKGKDAELDKVVDLHTALAKYKCKECDKEFISERNLHFHLRLHVKELVS